MKIHRGLVYTDLDPFRDATLMVQLKDSTGELGAPQAVTYLSPQSNSNAGFFALPTPGSEVIIMQVESEDDPIGDAIGYFYMGSVVGVKTVLGKCISEDKLNVGLLPEWGIPQISLDEPETVDQTSLGRNDPGSLSIPPEAAKAWKGKEIIAEKQVWEDPGGNAVVLSHQSAFGESEGYQNEYLKLQTGDGKHITLCDSPATNFIEISPDGGAFDKDVVQFAGQQKAWSAEGGHTLANGEFRVNTRGPLNFTSREGTVNVELETGTNIDIINNSNGVDHRSGPKEVVTAGGVLPPVQQAIAAATGPPYHAGHGAYQEGSPTALGDTETGCVNITSTHNNITLNALSDDSVVYINTPGGDSKVTINSGGTVDVIANGKISLSSDVKIELNAPFIDINGGVQVDMDTAL